MQDQPSGQDQGQGQSQRSSLGQRPYPPGQRGTYPQAQPGHDRPGQYPPPGTYPPPQQPGQPSYQGQQPYQGQYKPPDYPQSAAEAPTKKRRSWIPSVFFGILAIALAAVALILFFQDEDEPGVIIPTAASGENQLIHLEVELDDAGFDAQAGPRTNLYQPLQTPGQEMIVDGTSIWVFIYFGGAEMRQQAQDAVTDETIPITSASGVEYYDGPTELLVGSNMIVVVPLDEVPDDTFIPAIQDALDNLA